MSFQVFLHSFIASTLGRKTGFFLKLILKADRERNEHERHKERKILHLLAYSQVVVMAKTRPHSIQDPEASMDIPHGCRGPVVWAILCWFPKCISQKLGWKWNKQVQRGDTWLAIFPGNDFAHRLQWWPLYLDSIFLFFNIVGQHLYEWSEETYTQDPFIEV